MKKAFIYCITCLVNGKKYIGQTTRLKERLVEHKYGNNGCVKLSNAIKKHKWENFDFEIIEELFANQQYIDQREIHWIRFYDSINAGYNLTYGGFGGSHSEESRRKMSASHTGHRHTPETKKKISEANKGIKPSEATISALRKYNISRKFSEETRRKMVVAHTGKPSGMFGKTHSDETKKKIGERNAGSKNPMYGISRKHTEEETIKFLNTMRISWLKKYSDKRDHVFGLLLRGFSQRKIANDLKISKKTCERIIKRFALYQIVELQENF